MTARLYKVLGVKDDASQDEIKAAHRKRAKETHPDVGGKADEFAEVSRAFRVLSDDQRRLAYDQTGKEDAGPKTEDAAVIMVRNLVESFINDGANALYTDFAARMKHQLVEAVTEARQHIASISQKIARCETMAKRYKVKTGSNLIRSVLEARIAEMKRQITAIEKQIEVFKAAAIIAAAYSYDVEPVRTDAYYGMGQQAQGFASLAGFRGF